MTRIPGRALLLLGWLAPGLCGQAIAKEVYVRPTISGGTRMYLDDQGGRAYYKVNGDLSYGFDFVGHHAIWHQAFLKFSVDSLPDTCVVISTELHYCQYSHAVGLPQVDVKVIRDPEPMSAEELYSEIGSSMTITPVYESQDGWMSVSFDSRVFSRLDSCYNTGVASLGIHYTSGHNYSATAYGYDREDSPYLHIVYATPHEADIQALRAELTCPVVARRSGTVLLVLKNKGLHVSGQFWAHATAAGLGAESTLVASIAVGELVSVALPLPTFSKPETLVTYRLWSACNTDPWHANDTAQLTCWFFPPNTYAAEGFDVWLPPLRWVVVDNDNGSEGWQRRTDAGIVHSGAGFAMCAREQSGHNDDWLISGPVYPKTDQPDSLGFFCRLYQAGPPMSLQTWAMRGHRVSDTVLRLTSGSVSDTSYQRRSAPLDEFDGDTIYIGFRCQSSGGWNALCLDDVWFSGFVPPDPSDTTDTVPPQRDVVRRASTKLPDLAFAPNPSGSKVVTVQSAITVGKKQRLALSNVVGRVVRTFLLDPTGIANLDLRGLPSGVYMARLEAGTQSLTRKLVITSR